MSLEGGRDRTVESEFKPGRPHAARNAARSPISAEPLRPRDGKLGMAMRPRLRSNGKREKRPEVGPSPRQGPERIPPNQANRRVLAATDFSRPGNDAIRLAYELLPAGGRVKLVHVCPPWIPPSPLFAHYERNRPSRGAYRRIVAELRKKLQARIPPAAVAAGITTEVEVIASAEISRAIQAAARDFRADLLCLGSRGRGLIASTVLGSVAQKLATAPGPPVVLVRPARGH